MKERSSGQTLIELIISISFVLVIITVVAILTANGLKNSQLSRNQVQAAKLAQEGMEKIRTLRDKAYLVCGPPLNTKSNPGIFFANGSCPSGGSPNPCLYVLQTSGTCAGTAVTDPYFINFIGNQSTNPAQFEAIDVNGLTFKRVMSIMDSTDISGAVTTNVKEINVTVSWKDFSGTHSSNVSTKLSNL